MRHIKIDTEFLTWGENSNGKPILLLKTRDGDFFVINDNTWIYKKSRNRYRITMPDAYTTHVPGYICRQLDRYLEHYPDMGRIAYHIRPAVWTLWSHQTRKKS